MKTKSGIILTEKWDKIFYEFNDDFNMSNYSFPLYLFTKRLYENLKKNGCKNVLFMSREGQFLKKLFDKYCEIKKTTNENFEIKTHYFYGSRNSVMTASLQPIEVEDFKFLFRYFNFMSANSFLYSIGFSDEQIDETKKIFGTKLNRFHLNFKSSKIFKELKHNSTFIEIYNKNRNEQSAALKNYIDSFKIDYKKDGFTFVDIGYHGTMQDLIFKFFKNEISLKGYFIKCRAKTSSINSKIGLLSDGNNKKLFGNKINRYDAYNYEQILRANHGRCIGYLINDEGVGVELLDTKLDETMTYEIYVEKMQNQIFKKFEEIAKNDDNQKNIDKICVIYYYYTIKCKSQKDYNWLLNMQDSHHDDFGIVGYSGKIFSRGLRRFAFKLKDHLFVANNKHYINKLKREIL